MTLKQAIKKAEEGGYRWDEPGPKSQLMPGMMAIVLLDPLFWKCLGKALGWKETLGPTDVCLKCLDRYKPVGWKQQWHRFIDHLADGKDAESFFETLQF